MAFFSVTIDFPQAWGSTNGITRADYQRLPFPNFWLDVIDWWLDNDPLAKANPLWFRALAVVSPTLYLPFYLFAIWAFITGQEFIRTPGIMWASCMLIGLAIIMTEELAGPFRAPVPAKVIAAYTPYIMIPMSLLYRLAGTQNLFHHPSSVVQIQ